MNIEVRLYEKGDEEKIIELLEKCFPGWPERDLEYSKKDFYEWKYLDNPLKKTVNIVGLDGSKVVCCSHGILANVKVGNTIVLSCMGSDLCVHPSYRGKGLTTNMRNLRNEVRDELDVYFNFAAAENPIIVNGRKRRGTQIFPHSVIEMLWINDVNLHLQMTKTKWSAVKTPALKAFKMKERIRTLFNKISNENRQFDVEITHSFNGMMNSFMDAVLDYYNFIVVKDDSYMKWRYCDPRGGKYYIYQALSEEGMLGYVVLRINKYNPEYPTGWIVDLLSLPRRNDVLLALIEEALRFFETNDVNVVRHWLVKGNEYEKPLSDKGFLNINKVAPEISAKPLKTWDAYDVFRKSEPSKLHLQVGDTEYI